LGEKISDGDENLEEDVIPPSTANRRKKQKSAYHKEIQTLGDQAARDGKKKTVKHPGSEKNGGTGKAR